jgi:hypothetical protein
MPSLPGAAGLPPECFLPPEQQEQRLSYRGYLHCELHTLYQVAFAKWDCKCQSGQCRPTRVRPTKLGSTTGYDIEVDGEWFPVPESAYKTEKTDMSPRLLEFDAHVCASAVSRNYETKAPITHIECAWIKLGA